LGKEESNGKTLGKEKPSGAVKFLTPKMIAIVILSEVILLAIMTWAAGKGSVVGFPMVSEKNLGELGRGNIWGYPMMLVFLAAVIAPIFTSTAGKKAGLSPSELAVFTVTLSTVGYAWISCALLFGPLYAARNPLTWGATGYGPWLLSKGLIPNLETAQSLMDGAGLFTGGGIVPAGLWAYVGIWSILWLIMIFFEFFFCMLWVKPMLGDRVPCPYAEWPARIINTVEANPIAGSEYAELAKEPSRFKRLFTKLFMIGLLIGLFCGIWGPLPAVFPGQLDLWWYPLWEKISYPLQLNWGVFPYWGWIIWGLLWFVPLWAMGSFLFWGLIFTIIYPSLLTVTGVLPPGPYGGPWHGDTQVISDGAMFAFLPWLIFHYRRQLADGLRGAIKGTSQKGEVPDRWIWIGLVVSLIAWLGYAGLMGADPFGTIIILVMWMVSLACFMVLFNNGGYGWWYPSYAGTAMGVGERLRYVWSASRAVGSFAGDPSFPTGWGDRAMGTSWMGNQHGSHSSIYVWDQYGMSGVFNATNFKLGDMVGMPRREMFKALIFILITMAIVAPVMYWGLGFMAGLDNGFAGARTDIFGGWGTDVLQHGTMIGPNQGFSSPPPDLAAPWSGGNEYYIFGFVLVLVLFALGRFPWFPGFMHPIGLAGALTYTVTFGNYLIPWFLKWVTIKIGGSKGYESMSKIMIGVVFGYGTMTTLMWLINFFIKI
jgi:hypothetical protein